MAVIIDAGWVGQIQATLKSVQTEGQAYAAALAADNFAANAMMALTGGGSYEHVAWREQAYADVDSARQDMQRAASVYSAGSTSPVGASWPQCQQRILYLYNLAQVIAGQFGDDASDFVDAVVVPSAESLATAVAEAPAAVAQAVADVVTDVASPILGAAGKIVKKATSDIVWPLVLAAGAVLAVVVAALYVGKKATKEAASA